MICSPTFKVIQFYKGQGLVSVFQWNLPLKSQKEIRTEAMFTAMNDCTLRSVGRYDLLTIVDIDEFILPTRPNSTQARARPEQEPDTNYPTLVDLMAKSVIKHPKVGSFVFCNVFHYLYWENATNLLEKYWPVNTQGIKNFFFKFLVLWSYLHGYIPFFAISLFGKKRGEIQKYFCYIFYHNFLYCSRKILTSTGYANKIEEDKNS